MLSLACLMPLAACAAQQGSTEPPAVAQPAPTAAAAQQPAPAAPAAREQQHTATPATRPQAAASPPARAAPANASRPAAPAAGDAPSPIAPQESVTTVGEVPTTAQGSAGQPPADARPAQVVPGAPANPVTIPQPAPGPSTGSLLQTIFGLVLVLALLAALAWLAKRYGPKIAGGGGNLRMVGALNIGGRERIMVVEVGDQWIVVGASPGRINALATMPKQEAAASGAVQSGATLAGQAPPAASFSDWLKQTIDKRNAK